MSKSDLYRIVTLSASSASVRFETGSEILGAHFPERAIVPGSCLIETARELIEKIVDKPLYIKDIKNVKFVSVIEPAITPEVFFDFEKDGGEEAWRVTVYNEERTFAKMKIVFSYEQ